MRTNLIIKNGKTPKTNRQWFNIAPPTKGKKQWVPYHSASELADYFLCYQDKVPFEIDNVLDDAGVSKDASFVSEPECKTPLIPESIFGINGPRNHDILMIAENDVVIGVEAKATETLDKYVTSYDISSDNAKLRYPGLCKQILGKNIQECKNIRYQLLSAAAGTLIEAEKHSAKKAVLLVILFNSKIVSPLHVQATRENIEDFKNALKELEINKGRTESFITPFKPEIELFVKFIVVDVCQYRNKQKLLVE